MGDISTEQKLQLVQMIRAENRDNRIKMRSREKLLYGTDNGRNDDELPLYSKGYYKIENGRNKEMHALESESKAEEGNSRFGLRLRIMLAAVLFTGFLVMDASGGKVGGISSEQLREEINKNFDTQFSEVTFDFEHNFPYTLFHKD